MALSTGDRGIDYVLSNHREVKAVVELWALANRNVPKRVVKLVRQSIRERCATTFQSLQLRTGGLNDDGGFDPWWQDSALDSKLDPTFIWNTNEDDFDAILQKSPHAVGSLTLEVPYSAKEHRAAEWIALVRSKRSKFNAHRSIQVLPDGDEIVENAKDEMWFVLLRYRIDKRFVSKCLRDNESLQQMVADTVNSFTRETLPLLQRRKPER